MDFHSLEDKRKKYSQGKSGGRSAIGPTEIRIAVNKGTSTQKNNTCRLVIGMDIIDKLRWVSGDVIEVDYNDDKIQLSRNNVGVYRLQQQKNKAYRFGFPCFKGMPFHSKLSTSETTHWEYYKEGLLLNWPTVK